LQGNLSWYGLLFFIMQNRKNNRLNIWWISETLLKNRSFATPLLIQKIDRFRGFIIGITIGQEIGVRVEWHLLKLLGVAIFSHIFSGNGPGFGE